MARSKSIPKEHRWFRVTAHNGLCVETTPWTTLGEANTLVKTFVGLAAPVVIELTEDGGKTAKLHRTVVGHPHDRCEKCGSARQNHVAIVGCVRFIEKTFEHDPGCSLVHVPPDLASCACGQQRSESE